MPVVAKKSAPAPRESPRKRLEVEDEFIDEIETDAPVPFNIPIEFDGEPKYGEHDVTITVRYKDSVRDEIFLPYENNSLFTG